METGNERDAREWETPDIVSTIRGLIIRQNVMGIALSESELDRLDKFRSELDKRGMVLPNR